jgi:hypothetical protein
VGEGKDRRRVVAIESAGVLLDQRAHREVWPIVGSTSETCALHGGSRFWTRGGKYDDERQDMD